MRRNAQTRTPHKMGAFELHEHGDKLVLASVDYDAPGRLPRITRTQAFSLVNASLAGTGMTSDDVIMNGYEFDKALMDTTKGHYGDVTPRTAKGHKAYVDDRIEHSRKANAALRSLGASI